MSHVVLSSKPWGEEHAQRLSLSQQQKAGQLSKEGMECPWGTTCIFKTSSQWEQEEDVPKTAPLLPAVQRLPKTHSEGCPMFVHLSATKTG